MQLDDEVCLCFHVTKRKLQNFLRVEKPRRVAQMSECFGAGTFLRVRASASASVTADLSGS